MEVANPLANFRGKTATLTTRITPETRTALDRRAKEHGRSLSQEVERCLTEAVYLDRGDVHVRGLAHAITLLIQATERATKERWVHDRFTCEAVRFGIETLLIHFAPQGTSVVPSSVVAASLRMPAQTADRYRTPAGLAEMEAFNLIAHIEAAPEPPRGERAEIHYPDDMYTRWQIRRDIGSASAAKRKGQNKETNR